MPASASSSSSSSSSTTAAGAAVPCDAAAFLRAHKAFMNSYGRTFDGGVGPTEPQQMSTAAAILLLRDGLMTETQMRACMAGNEQALLSLAAMLELIDGVKPSKGTLLMGAYD